MSESFLISAAVTAMQFTENGGTHRAGDIRGAVGGVIVDDDDFVNERRERAQDLLYTLFFIQTRYDNSDFVLLVQTIPSERELSA